MRVPLTVLLVLLVAPGVVASPPLVVSDAGPAGGALVVDPILHFDAAYAEAGSTDCYHPADTCVVEGPGRAASWVRVVMAGKGSVHFFLDDASVTPNVQLVSGTCDGNGTVKACLFRLPHATTSPAFRLTVPSSWGQAGTTMSVYLEAGREAMGEQL